MNSSKIIFKTITFILISPFFMAGFCSKDDVQAVPPADATQFFTWNIMGIAGQVSSPKDSIAMSLNNNITTFSGKTIGSTVTANYRMSFPASSAGTYSVSNCLIYVSGKYFVGTINPISINVTAYGNTGSFVTGTYSGEIKDSTTGKIYAATGEFKIKR